MAGTDFNTMGKYSVLFSMAFIGMGLAVFADHPEGQRKKKMTQDGKHKHTNDLIQATSPYLLQHAHNPVNWSEWSPAALKRAAEENKPVFLSIGYAACHWCHVMEHESFENEAIAALLNAGFVCIKVDREERPDIDEIYMQATMAMNQGRGGWPMSVFMTSDGKPFFAGTYFPPHQFTQLLNSITEAWTTKRADIDKQGEAVARYLEQWARSQSPGRSKITQDVIANTARSLVNHFDPTWGGMSGGGTNKFPPSLAMELFLREHRRTGNAKLLDLVTLTLDKMAYGGVYDQLGGGIHRYSTDIKWLAPHFEKMLYDQGLVSSIYVDAFLVTKNPLYARIASEIFDYVIGDLQSSEGGFYSTRDADSEGEEGKFYLWRPEELVEVLGEEDAKVFAAYYDVTEKGNFHDAHGDHGNASILWVTRSAEVVAKEHGVTADELMRRLAIMREKLLAVREKRVHPGLDDKILSGWNGLMVGGMAKGARVFDEPKYAEAAGRAADFVLTELRKDGRLLRTYRDGKAHLTGYLADYAFFIEGLLNLYEATFSAKWLVEAEALNETLIRHYYDEGKGGFFFTAGDHETLIVRTKDPGDGAEPSGNSVQVMNLLRLATFLDRQDLRDKARATINLFAEEATERVGMYERLLCAVDFDLNPGGEVAIVGKADDSATKALIRTVNSHYMPNRVMALLDPTAGGAEAWSKRIPLLTGKSLVDGKPAAYVCQNYTCQRPVTTPEELGALLGGKPGGE